MSLSTPPHIFRDGDPVAILHDLTPRTIRGAALPPQLFTGRTKPRAQRLRPPTNTGFIKPLGGFWTSSITAHGTSDWVDWCRAEMESWIISATWWRLIPDPDATLLVVDTEVDLLALCATYGVAATANRGLSFLDIGGGFATLDYERMAADTYDGLHLTDNGQAETRFSRPSLYGWDVESTLWFRWAFIGPPRKIPVVPDTHQP